MPYLEIIGREENQDDDGHQARRQVAEHHYQLSIPAVDEGAGDGAQQHSRAEGEEGNQRQGRGLARNLPGPDGEGEPSHAAAQQGDNLADPNDGEPEHAGWAGLGSSCHGEPFLASCVSVSASRSLVL